MNTQVSQRGFKSKAERLSIEYREALSIKAWEPLCAFKLAQYLQIFVTSPIALLNSEVDTEKLCASDSGWSALVTTNKFQERIIIHNTKSSPARQQSDLMHELAHIICEHEIPDHYKEFRLPSGMVYNNVIQESEAKFLGAALQLSKACLHWALKRGMNSEKIALHFNASEEMVKYRLNVSGVLIQRKYMGTSD